MRPKTIDYNDKKLTYKQNPGPGSYVDYDLAPKSGRFTISKFSDFKLAKINSKTPRFQDAKEGPGPSSYVEGENLSNRGKYVLSNHKGAGTRTFGQTARSTFTDEFRKTGLKFPGPGDYQPPSEFGVYGDADYYKTMKDFKTIS